METITVIGSLNMDLVVRTPRVPQAGETLAGTDFHIIPGGKGANQAVACARAGAPTRLIGCVGEDIFASQLLQSLEASGVDISGVSRVNGVSSGTATILVDDRGQNRIIYVPGANARLSTDTIRQQFARSCETRLVLLQHEIPLQTVHDIIELAHARDIHVMLNPAPFYPIPERLMAQIDTLILNEIEATALSGLGVVDPRTARQAAEVLLRQGVANVIITLGEQGALLFGRQGELFQPAFKVNAVDSTAAGDTFTGGYAASIMVGKEPPAALLYATAAAALCVTRLGAQTSIPTREEVQDFLAVHTGRTALNRPRLYEGN